MKKVVVYSVANCPACERAKEWFRQRGVKYEERRVDEDDNAADELRSRGMFAAPVVRIGDEWIVGFTPRRLKEALEEGVE